MPEYQEKSKVVFVELIAPGIVRLTLHAPLIVAAASPGQFVMLQVNELYDPLLRRPFSIHTTASDGNLQILFKVVGQGTALLSALQVDHTIDLIGPLGHGFLHESGQRVGLVGGGMGIAPLHFLARRILQKDHSIHGHRVLLGARNQAELVPLLDEFRDMGYVVQVATDDGSLGHRGFIPDLLEKSVSSLDMVYCCGPWAMMRSVAAICQQAGVACQVSLETHMACGLGVCLGCTLLGTAKQYLHVCKEGPVFLAQEVRWDQ